MLTHLREFIVSHPREILIAIAIIVAILWIGSEVREAFIDPNVDLLMDEFLREKPVR